MDIRIKTITEILVIIAVLSIIASPSLASSPKEEVIYVNLNNDGSADELYVVNIFEPSSVHTRIEDYGYYKSVRNMVTNDEIHVNEDEITIDTDSSSKIYYEGIPYKCEIPWNIDIRYYLNGNEYSADDIAGLTGTLRMDIDISENKLFRSNFYKDYAVLVTISLDSNKCRNITADGASIANVGGDKQLTYTIMPNKGASLSIYSDVVNFEMNEISVSCVKLSMDIDFDTSEMEADLKDLEDAAAEIDDGAENLSKGAGQLYSGASQLYYGSQSLASGLDDLKNHNSQIVGGADMIFNSLISQVNNTANQILMSAGKTPINITKDNYSSALPYLYAQTENPNFTDMLKQLAGYQQFYDGLITYTNGVSSAASGSSSLVSGASSLLSGTNQLRNGASELKDGTGKLRENTSGLDRKLTDKKDEVLKPIRGGSGETISFVSSKNTNVNSVQFVMHTEGIKKVEETPAAEDYKKPNFFEKLLKLFGFQIR